MLMCEKSVTSKKVDVLIERFDRLENSIKNLSSLCELLKENVLEQSKPVKKGRGRKAVIKE